MAGERTALPPDWELRVSRSKGKVFYYNSLTKQTQWMRPVATVGDAAAASASATGEEQLEAPRAKRQRTAAREDEQPADADESAAQSGSGSALRALIAASMRTGGASTRGSQSKPVAFSPWEHQLNAVEKLITAIQTDPLTGGQEQVGRHVSWICQGDVICKMVSHY